MQVLLNSKSIVHAFKSSKNWQQQLSTWFLLVLVLILVLSCCRFYSSICPSIQQPSIQQPIPSSILQQP